MDGPLEQDSNLQPYGHKAPNLPLSHHTISISIFIHVGELAAGLHLYVSSEIFTYPNVQM